MAINNTNKSVLKGEFLESAWPWVTSSTVSAAKEHLFYNVTSFVAVKNAGVSGSLHMAFTATGFGTSNFYTIAAGETVSLPFALTSLNISGTAAQPYQILAGITSQSSSLLNPVSLANGYLNV